jgi:predicted PurR-regulated permease PerM
LLFLAAILTVLFLPLHNFLTKKIKNSGISALIIILLILSIVIVPLIFLGQAIIKEMIDFINQNNVEKLWSQRQLFVDHLPDTWQKTGIDFINNSTGKLSLWANNFILNITSLLSNVAGFLFSCFLLFFSTFYLLKDHKKIKSFFIEIFPLSTSQEDLIITKVANSIKSVVRGSFIMALLQGTAATIGFVFAGVPQPLFWGSITVISAFVPMVGTSLIMIPAIIYLFLFKSFSATIIMIVWYGLVNISLDNIVGPRLIGSKTRIHPLLVLLSILGGLQFFGPLGFLFGPIIMAIFVALIESYRTGFKA